MLGRFLELGGGDADELLQRAERVEFCAAQDGVRAGGAGGRVGFGAVGRGGPARAGVQDDAFVQPGGGGGRGAGGDDGAAAVGEEGHVEGGAGVEVLADEEVAVVERGGVHADEDFVGLGGGVGDLGYLETGEG